MAKIQIFPRSRPCFFAVPFTGERESTLLSALADLDLELVQEHNQWYIDGNTKEDTMRIPSGYYFVRCGPYWDVMSPTELTDDFVIG